MSTESWLPSGKHLISNFGRVKKANGTVQAVSATGKYAHLGRGYLAFRSGGTLTKVHRAVAILFVPNPLKLSQINHKNGATTDNRAENLEWITSSGNQLHALRTGLRVPLKGPQVTTSIIQTQAVLQLRRELDNGMTHRKAAKRFGISKTQVGRIARKESWAWL